MSDERKMLTVEEATRISNEERGPCVCLGTCCGMDADIPCLTFDRLCATARVGAKAMEAVSEARHVTRQQLPARQYGWAAACDYIERRLLAAIEGK